MLRFEDRVVQHPNRVVLTPVAGKANTYDVRRDEGRVTVEGTPLVAETLNTLVRAQFPPEASDANNILGPSVQGIWWGAANNPSSVDGYILTIPWENPEKSNIYRGQLCMSDSLDLFYRRIVDTTGTWSKWQKFAKDEHLVRFSDENDSAIFIPDAEFERISCKSWIRVNRLALNNAPAIIFDGPDSYFSGIGLHGEQDTIFFGATDRNTQLWVDSHKQKWKFNGSVEAVTVKASNIYTKESPPPPNTKGKVYVGNWTTGSPKEGHYYLLSSFRGVSLGLAWGSVLDLFETNIALAVLYISSFSVDVQQKKVTIRYYLLGLSTSGEFISRLSVTYTKVFNTSGPYEGRLVLSSVDDFTVTNLTEGTPYFF